MKFSKYHGLGNDFLIVDGTSPAFDLSPEAVVRLCDRRRGVGADGVLVYARDPDARVPSMVIYNADGSRPQMCGNGLRCFVRWLVDVGYADVGDIAVATDAGLRVSTLAGRPEGNGEDGAAQVSVDMGAPVFDRSRVPMLEGDATNTSSLHTLHIEGEHVRLRGVSMGNPHAVVQLADPDTMAAAKRLGEAVSKHPLFPEQCNAGFAWLDGLEDGEPQVRLTVWERGCGITDACGTGACAAVAALSQDHPVLVDRDVPVTLPGGTLVIRVPSDGGGIVMRGPAVRLFEVESWW